MNRKRFIGLLLAVLLHTISHAELNEGKLTQDVGTHDTARSSAYTSDGRVVLFGAAKNSGEWDILVTRYHADGSLDTSFSDDGMLTNDIGRHDIAMAGLIDTTDDKPIVVGITHNGSNYDLLLLRYNTDGSLDTSFELDGMVSAHVNRSDIGRAAVFSEVHGGQKIVVIGAVNSDHAVFRFHSNGSLDTSFDSDGIATHQLSTSNDQGYAGVAQSDERIITGGTTKETSGYELALLRFNTDGTLDTSFDEDGLTTHSILSHSYIFSLGIDDNGLVYSAGGTTHSDGLWKMSMTRFHTNGTLDTSFDEDGVQTYATSTRREILRGMTIQEDGKPLASGFFEKTAGADYEYAMIRLNTDGSLDTTFDNDGFQTQGISASNQDVAFAMIRNRDGVNWAVGRTKNTDFDVSIVRYDLLGKVSPLSGALDVSFSGDGCVTFDLGVGAENGYRAAKQDDGKIIFVGYDASPDAVIGRLSLAGTLDTTFSNDGKVIHDWGGTDNALAIQIQADGKIVISGDTDGVIATSRYNSNGTLDTSFDGDGLATLSTGATESYGLTIDSQGKITVLGEKGGAFLLNRFNSNGSADTTFSEDGIAQGGSASPASDMALDSQGNLVVTGIGSDYAVARFSSNGQLDTSFDNDGFQTIAVGPGSDYSYGITIHADNRITIVGAATFTGTDLGVVRLTTNGGLDTSFHIDGIFTQDLAGSDNQEYWRGVSLHTNEKIYLAGQVNDAVEDYFALARLLTNGQLDTTFDLDGLSTSEITSAANDMAWFPLIQQNGQILSIGSANNGQGFAFCRYHP